jgi:hypothetical protein
VAVALTDNVVLVVAELVDYQLQHQVTPEPVEHNPLVVQVVFPIMDIQEPLVLHTKVEIRAMKAAVVVVVTSAAVAVEITQVVLVDLATPHF